MHDYTERQLFRCGAGWRCREMTASMRPRLSARTWRARLMKRNFLTIMPDDGLAALKGFASPIRLRMLKLIYEKGPLNINEISNALKLPQSTVASNMQMLEEAGLVLTQTIPARGIC
jgi:DNA-binding MarR family transcriptional regulator